MSSAVSIDGNMVKVYTYEEAVAIAEAKKLLSSGYVERCLLALKGLEILRRRGARVQTIKKIDELLAEVIENGGCTDLEPED